MQGGGARTGGDEDGFLPPSTPLDRWMVAIAVECAFVVTYVSYWIFLNNHVSKATAVFVQLLFFIYFPLYNLCVFSDPGVLKPTGDSYVGVSEYSDRGSDLKQGYQSVGAEDEVHLEEGRTEGENGDASTRTNFGQSALGTTCDTCHLLRPVRAKHCRVCGFCVETMDHHCIFTGNCVGNGNRLLFIIMVCSALPSHALICHCLVVTMGGYLHINKGMNENPFLGALFVFHALSTVFMAALVAFHTYSISYNITTNEFWNWMRYRHFQTPNNLGPRYPPTFRNPFDKGVSTNWAEFLSSQFAHCPPRLMNANYHRRT
mmetsp:Transcript_12553/g.30906  ORF Transcript_12553/g.30906 Transcript_12553/m.30906 type:complete len:317 (-) Transcript_12553:327-1277(-)